MCHGSVEIDGERGALDFFKYRDLYGFSTKHLKMLKINDDSFLAGPPRLAINALSISTQDGGCKQHGDMANENIEMDICSAELISKFQQA